MLEIKSKMKVLVAFVVLCALFGLHQAKVTPTGQITNQKFIDRTAVYAIADPKGYVTEIFTFPPVS